MLARVRKHLGTIIVAALVGALAAGGPAVAGSVVDFARHAGDADTVDGIDASRKPVPGQLLALNANRKFPSSVVPEGSTGPRGPAGPAGLKGDPGPTGPQGAKGETGATGARGATGAQGSPGSAGSKGEKGDTGSTGATGAPGAKGDKGDQGLQGVKGDTGVAGATGAKGDTGAQGAKGDKGDQGNAGADGAPGAKGDKGETGNAGANGAPGAPGATGDKGDKGDKGDQGTAGANGAPGEKGDKGDAGSAAAYPPIVDVNPILRPSRSNLWDRIQVNGNSWFNGYRSSFPTGTDASYLEWDLPLQAGKWAIEVVYVKSPDAGILSLSLGESGFSESIDAFSPAENGIAFNQVATFTGVSVATTGIHTLRIATPTKNALSGGNYGYLVAIRLVRE